MSRAAVIVDFAAAKWYSAIQAELWPDPETRPIVVQIPNSTAGSTAHENWVRQYRASHNGRFVRPFLAEHGAGEAELVGTVGFSAGCWGVGETLRDPDDAKQISMVALIDGLHGSWRQAPAPSMQERSTSWAGVGKVKVGDHWMAYAQRAIRGDAVMAVTYSRIIPPYPGTRETAVSLARDVEAQPVSIELGIPIDEAYSAGGLLFIGASPPEGPGDDAAAHIYQAQVVQQAIWRSVVKPWSEGQMVQASMLGDGSAKKILILVGALGFLLWAWVH